MSKLLTIKGCLSETETSQYLTKALGETVSIAQIYELCLEGHLNVSAKFMKKAFATRTTDCSANLDDAQLSNTDETVKVLDGVWDLAMIGDEYQDIKQRYQEESQQTYPETKFVRGLYFKRDNEVYKAISALLLAHSSAQRVRLDAILSSNGYTEEELFDESMVYQVFESLTDNEIEEVLRLTAALADDVFDMDEELLELETPVYQLVFRVSELNSFIHSLNSDKHSDLKEDKPLATKERNTYLTLINALLKNRDFDPSSRGLTSSLAMMTEESGAPLSENTIRKILREINEINA